MYNKVLSYIKSNNMINDSDKVLIGVSGGVDSIVLLDIIMKSSSIWNIQIFVAHVNHMLRGEEANEDENFVIKICERYNIQCFTTSVNVKEYSKTHNISIEEAGRNVRYNFFKEVKEKYKIDKIALAHHMDDNAETILMRIIRGTGVKGLKGIDPVRGDGIIRPFLSVSKNDIIEYCNKNSLSIREDKTNFNTEYHRNILRLEVMPYLRRFNPNLRDSINNLGTISREYYEYVSYESEKWYNKVVHDDKIFIKEFNNLHLIIKREIIRKLINDNHNIKDVQFQHVQAILEKLKDNSSLWVLDLPKGIKAMREYDYIYIKSCVNEEMQYFEYPIQINKGYVFTKLNIFFNSYIIQREKYNLFKKNANRKFLDYDKIDKKLVLRQRKPGDRIHPVGIKGSKKIKDIFIDKKIPKHLRSTIPLLTSKDDVLWILGYHINDRYKITEKTRQILLIEYKNYKEDSTCMRI